MVPMTVITWIIILFGLVTNIPLFYVQYRMIRDPCSRAVMDMVIGKDRTWRDGTHFRTSLAYARADWIVIFPLLVVGTAGVILGTAWGYIVYAVAGGVAVYISAVLFFQEKEIVYPSVGPLAYYTYYWGNFVYWGLIAVVYAILRLEGFVV